MTSALMSLGNGDRRWRGKCSGRQRGNSLLCTDQAHLHSRIHGVAGLTRVMGSRLIFGWVKAETRPQEKQNRWVGGQCNVRKVKGQSVGDADGYLGESSSCGEAQSEQP